MPNYKLVITGTYAAGKSQFIRHASEIEVVDTEAPVSHAQERTIKAFTTVGLDFGTLQIDPQTKLFLFGTPGQERFDFLWEHLALGCLGYVVLVDSRRPGELKAAARLIHRFAHITPAPFVVAANKQDAPDALPPDYIHMRLGLPPSIPVLPCIARDIDSVHAVLYALLDRVEALAAGHAHEGASQAA
jgi:signal recognition particle receptor subunit beta